MNHDAPICTDTSLILRIPRVVSTQLCLHESCVTSMIEFSILGTSIEDRRSINHHLYSHCTHTHEDVFTDVLGQHVPRIQWLDYLEEAVKVRERGDQGLCSVALRARCFLSLQVQ